MLKDKSFLITLAQSLLKGLYAALAKINKLKNTNLKSVVFGQINRLRAAIKRMQKHAGAAIFTSGTGVSSLINVLK